VDSLGLPPSLLSDWSDQQVLEVYSVLSLVCGRSKTALRKKKRRSLCFGLIYFDAELQRRQIPYTPHVTTGDDVVI